MQLAGWAGQHDGGASAAIEGPAELVDDRPDRLSGHMLVHDAETAVLPHDADAPQDGDEHVDDGRVGAVRVAEGEDDLPHALVVESDGSVE